MWHKFRQNNQMYNGLIRQIIHLNNTGVLVSAFLKDIFQQNFKVQKSIFMKYVIVILWIIPLHSLSFFNDKV